MSELTSKYFNYTTFPIQESLQCTDDYTQKLLELKDNNFNNILIIIGGSYHNEKYEYDEICKNMRLLLENYVDGNNLIINIDGEIDKLNPKNNNNNTYVHLKLFLSEYEDCPFNIELIKFIDNFLEKKSKIFIINSIFEYRRVIFSHIKIMNIFKKYNDNDNIKIVNYIKFPSSTIHNKTDCSFIVSKMISGYNDEFEQWKKLYNEIYSSNYKDDIKCNNLRNITFDIFLIYLICYFF